MSRFVTFQSTEVGITVRARLTGPSIPVQHSPAGWQAVQRVGRPSFTEWQGEQGWEIPIPIAFEGFGTNTSQEADILKLEMLGQPWEKFKPVRTPIVTFDSNGDIPHDSTRSPMMRWVIQDLAWGDYISNRESNRVRQICTVTVWEYAPDAIMPKPHWRNLPTGQGDKSTGFHYDSSTTPTSYTVQAGDTLQKISARIYGNATEWKAIATLNKIRDPNHLKVGLVLKLPKL